MHIAAVDVIGRANAKLRQGFFYLRRKRQLRVEPCAIQLASTQDVLRDDGERRRYPTATAIEHADGVLSVDLLRKLDDRGPLIRRFREDLNCTAAAESTKALARADGDVARHARQTLDAAERLQVFVQNLIDRRLSRKGLREDDVGLKERFAIHGVDRRHRRRNIAASMTGPARHDLT